MILFSKPRYFLKNIQFTGLQCNIISVRISDQFRGVAFPVQINGCKIMIILYLKNTEKIKV